jgi:hypothetical protein
MTRENPTYWQHHRVKTGKRQIERTCEGCGVTVFVWPSRIKGHIFCSKECRCEFGMGRETGYLSVALPFEEDRFWRKVRIENQESCWEWQHATNGKYPKYGITGKRPVYAHRYVEETINGPIPRRIEVCHSCDNPICVNPGHLFRGTRRVNVEDMHAKGRGFIPPPHVRYNVVPFVKLDYDIADRIREDYSSGETVSSLAERFGVSMKSITRVIHGRAWVRGQNNANAMKGVEARRIKFGHTPHHVRAQMLARD